jgi:hypothetical protein
LVDQRKGVPPNVNLDDRYFKKIQDVQQRVEATPSLVGCDSLTVVGNLSLAEGVRIQGDASLIGSDNAVRVPAGEYTGETKFN